MTICAILIWIGLIGAVSVGADSASDDYSKHCLKCAGDGFPECGINENSAQFNLTIYCRTLKEYQCTIRLVKTNASSIDELMCQIKQSNSDLEDRELDRDGVRIVTLLEPLPLLLQTAPKAMESIKTAIDEDHQKGIQVSLSSKEEPPTSPPVSHLAIVAKLDAAHALEAEDTGVDPNEAAAEVEEDRDVDEAPADPVDEADKEETATEAEEDKDEVNVAELSPDSAAEGTEVVAADGEAEVNDGTAAEEEAEVAEGASAQGEDSEEAAEQEVADEKDSSTETVSIEKEAAKQTDNTESVDYPGDEAVIPTAEMETEAGATVAEDTGNSDGDVSVTSASNNALGAKESVAVIRCFACTSLSDANCTTNPEVEVTCKPLQDTTENGCYTLVKVDLNTTTRGCISDLAEVGMKYCKDNGKFCMLCHADGCNNRQATTSGSCATSIRQHVILAVFLLAVTGAHYF